MSQHRVVELRRLLEPSGSPLASESGDVAWIGTLLEVLSACQVGLRWERAAVPCERPGCNGPVAIRRIGDACEWFCATCTTSGAVVSWRGSAWDLTSLAEGDTADRSEAFVLTRLEELTAVRRMSLPPELRLTLAMAQARSECVLLPCSGTELLELTQALEPQLAHLSEHDRRLVERFLARVDFAVLAREAHVDEPPTVH